MAGISRAVTMTAVYLMAVSCLKHREAVQVVKHCRHIASPNSGFMDQLADFEVKRISEVRLYCTRGCSVEDCIPVLPPVLACLHDI